MNSPFIPSCPVSVPAAAKPFRTKPAIAANPIEPASPPLPAAWKLPFQPDAGIHTSILISESLVGFNVAATRQNSGTSLKAAAPRAPAPGGVNWPAATVCTVVTVVLGSEKDLRLSQGTASNRAAKMMLINLLL